MDNLSEAFRNISIAIAASHRLGWIALGLYIEKMNVAPPANPYYKTLLEYHQAMGDEYKFQESIMAWADDYRMILFPNEFIQRLDAIDDGDGAFYTKELQKSLILRRAQRARNEIKNMWGNIKC